MTDEQTVKAFNNKIISQIKFKAPSTQVDRIEDKLETPQIANQIVTPQFLDRNLEIV